MMDGLKLRVAGKVRSEGVRLAGLFRNDGWVGRASWIRNIGRLGRAERFRNIGWLGRASWIRTAGYRMLVIATPFLYMQLVSTELAAQDNIQVSVNNIMNYGYGEESANVGLTQLDKEYFENFSDVRIIADNVTIGFRYELSQPAEYGPEFNGFRRRYIEYERDDLSVRVGDFYALANRGLSMNLFEDRVIRYDTGAEGFRAEYDRDKFRIEALAGRINYLEHLTFDSPSGIREEVYDLRSFSLELKPTRKVRFGGSMTYAEGELPEFGETVENEIVIPELFVHANLPFGRWHASINRREMTFANESDSTSGGGFYTSFSHAGSGYGITFEYKNYNYDEVDPFEWDTPDYERNTRISPFQSPPIAHKEHSYSLMTRDPHLVNFDDEVGFFLEGFYSPTYQINLNASFAMASIRETWGINPDFTVFKEKDGPTWLPSFSDERNPYKEFYIDGEYRFADFLSYVKAAYNYRDKMIYNVFTPDFSEKVRMNTFVLDGQMVINSRWSVKAISEHQFVSETFESEFAENKEYYNQMLTVQVSRSPLFSVGGRVEFTTSEEDPSGDKFWYTLEGSYRIGRTHTVMASYGSERGGFVCTNGVCRIVNAFQGFRLSVQSSF